MTFEEAFAKVVGLEGRYSDHPSDSGGATMYGITEAVARAYGFSGAMRDLPLAVAHEIYRGRYWDKLRLDQVAAIAGARVADEIFDTAVNQGAAAAGQYLQRTLNALNKRGTIYSDVLVDGDIGPVTIAALRSYLRHRGVPGTTVLLRALNALQGAFYIELAERREKDEEFVYGWLSNRIHFA
jgi:lysozyme family protein